MRPSLRTVMAVAAIVFVMMSLGCGTQGVDRVDVTWQSDPPPRWGLYPGYRQEIPCPAGASYQVDVFRKGKTFAGGTVTAVAGGLSFRPTAGAQSIQADALAPGRMNIYATVRGDDGESTRRLALRVERRDATIVFEFPK
jgi:hypothetical protein